MQDGDKKADKEGDDEDEHEEEEVEEDENTDDDYNQVSTLEFIGWGFLSGRTKGFGWFVVSAKLYDAFSFR